MSISSFYVMTYKKFKCHSILKFFAIDPAVMRRCENLRVRPLATAVMTAARP
jgi:hypothetical protein